MGRAVKADSMVAIVLIIVSFDHDFVAMRQLLGMLRAP
jgi:hypothetical protein